MKHDVIIVGGGVSGLSAGVELSARGAKVLLLEQKPHLGGRTYSYVDRFTGDVVDNGQHLLMGCYHKTREYLERIGSSQYATLQKNLQIEFLHPKNGRASLSCPPLPAPLHVLAGLLRLRSIPFRDRLKLLRVGPSLVSGTDEQRLASVTVDEWLRALGQSSVARKYLWDIIAIGSLNDHPATVSALLFYRVLQSAFLGNRKNASLLIPRVGLSELLVDPAVAFIRQHGGDVRTNVRIDRVEIARENVVGVWSGRKKFEAQAYISAVPWYALGSLIQHSTNAQKLRRFESSPILTINLWLNREVMEEEFVAVLDCRVQWVFNKTRMFGSGDGGEKRNSRGTRQYLACVISGAKEYMSWSKERIVATVMHELRTLFPSARGAQVIHAVVIKEKRATFSPRPEVEPRRPDVRTEWRNLFLAGDWTNTGYPATIEGAVLSGKRAAECAGGG